MAETQFRNKVLLFLICVVLFVFDGHAQTIADTKLPVDPSVKIGKLDNGLTYYIRKNTRPENKLELRLVVNAGSLLEDDDQQGLAHFTEHMAFNGSKNFEKNELVSFLQSIGVEFGADLNAYTGFNETVYILPIPTEKKENVEKAFQILEDWAGAVAFEDQEIDKERGVVLEESRLGKGADDRMQRVIYPKIFEDSKYAERLPIGKEEILKSFSYDVLKRFYKDWYRPDLMAVIAVGDYDPAVLEQMIRKHFGQLKNPPAPRPREITKLNERGDTEALVVTDKEATHHILQLFYSFMPKNPVITMANYREHLVERLFTSMLSQRIQELTQRPEPPFIYGGTFLAGFARGYEFLTSLAYVGNLGVEPAMMALVAENERARKFGFTANELDRAKKTMLKSIERTYNERDKTESSAIVEEYVRHFLNKEPIPGIENEYAYYQQYLEGISLQEVNTFAAAHLPTPESKKLIVLSGPEKASFALPSEEQLNNMATAATEQDIKPHVEKELAASLMAKSPKTGKILKSKELTDIGVHELTLSNGARVLLKPTTFKNDQVVFSATRFGGQYLFPVSDRYNAEYASSIVGQMGVAEFSPTDLKKVLAGKTASVNARMGNISETLSGQSSADDIETLLQLTYLTFTSPRKDSELFKSFVAKQQALYKNMLSDPEYVFQNMMVKELFKGHPRAPELPTAQTFERIDLDRSFSIYKERFSSAKGFTFILVGSFTLEKIKPLIETYLASIPGEKIPVEIKDPGVRPVKGPLKRVVEKGTEPKSLVRLMWTGETTFSEKEQFHIQALVEVFNIKLIETLREELSGVYGAGMYGALSKNPYPNYSIGVSIPCGPENVDKLIEATLNEVKKIHQNGPTQEDLNKVKETWRQQYNVNLKENNYWARQLSQSVETGSKLNSILETPEKINSLTPKDIQDVASKFLDTNNYLLFVLNPEDAQ